MCKQNSVKKIYRSDGEFAVCDSLQCICIPRSNKCRHLSPAMIIKYIAKQRKPCTLQVVALSLSQNRQLQTCWRYSATNVAIYYIINEIYKSRSKLKPCSAKVGRQKRQGHRNVAAPQDHTKSTTILVNANS